jgi:4-hydroxy-tetrahydrodipicolinate synthase
VFTHLVGTQVKEMIGRFKAGDRDGAYAIGAELEPVLGALSVSVNPIPVKAAMNLLGHDVGGLRLPLVEATEEEKGSIRDGLERVGLLAAAGAR